LLTTFEHPEAGSTHVLAPPYRFDGARLPVRSAPPQLGEGTSEVLQSLLGLSAERLSQLKAEGVV
jgi:crotonobetainyl-CoA:carnitine CoA-transferase CaiB-like acyl-CoA transferase